MPQSRSQSIDSIKKSIRDHDIQFVRFEQADLHGVSRSKTVPVNSFMDYLDNGLNFYGGLLGLDIQSMVPTGTGYAEEVSYADHCTVPDLSTFHILPWVPNTANITVDPYWYDGTPAMASPACCLKKSSMILMKWDTSAAWGTNLNFTFLIKTPASPCTTASPFSSRLKTTST